MDPTTDVSQGTQTPAPPSAEISESTAHLALLNSLYDALEQHVRAVRPEEDLSPLRRAYEFAREKHGKQMRKDGSPYLVHPIAVAEILAGMQLDLVALQTGLLHDVIEDTSSTVEEIKRVFGPDVARCVNGVTKLRRVALSSREVRQAESLRKMLLAMSEDIRVIIVKLADRLHNMRTLAALEPERRERIAAETLELYAPIAHRLGMGKVRAELEDLAFRVLHPEDSEEVRRAIENRRAATDEVLQEIQHVISSKLAADGIPAQVQGRVKRPYSVYQKLRRQKIDIEQVFDILGIRVITDSVRNCYAALGEVHQEWHPIPGRLKDFIAIPRPNRYQSLHTSVMGPGGLPFEVQIRTEEMHRIAEEGIAAHWKYKEGKRGPGADEMHIAWLRQLVEWQKDTRDSTDFLATLKTDLYAEEVYCFTPRGRVMALPRESTPVDFAYAVHSDVGHHCIGAKVNGRMVPLKHHLRNGDVVEILTQNNSQPSRDWLTFVKTSRARGKIRQVINSFEREKAIEIGEKLLDKEARRFGVSLGKITNDEFLAVAAQYGLGRLADLHAALGWGRFSARQVLTKLAPDVVLPEPPPSPAAPAAPAAPGEKSVPISIKGVDDVLTYFAKCCNPIKGDPIVGYITRGKGIAVHSTTCKNVQQLLYEAERRIDVEWHRGGAADTFHVRLLIHADDRSGMLHKLTEVLETEKTNISSVESKADHARLDEAHIDMTIEVRDKKQVERIVAAMRRIPGVRDVKRLT